MSFLKNLLLALCLLPAFADAYRSQEMRAVWIATVGGIDWPKDHNNPEAQKAEMIAILDSLKSCNINTVAFQVRPTSDAFYQSDLEPWSSYLMGKQGKAPSPFYDPLQFVIEEAHKRCMEVHVWINPYRVINSGTEENLVADHVYWYDHKLFKKYAGRIYFNPALQDTRDYLTMIVMDIVLRYDLDAIHFDDYFYPYKEKDEEFPDDDSFLSDPRGFKSKADWRRDNVSLVIEQLQHTIKAAKPWVEFGIAPFGRYDANYNELYADIKLWMQKGWIDYVTPQLYWALGHKTADFKGLYDWWSEESDGIYENKTFDCNFYTGLYVAGTEIYDYAPWPTPNEVVRQLKFSLSRNTDRGAFFYCSHYFLHNTQGLLDSLRSDYYQYPALPPSCPNLGGEASDSPSDVRISRGNDLSWTAVTDTEGMAVSYYVVYAFPERQRPLFDAKYILCTTPDNHVDLNPYFASGRIKKGDRIMVTSFNRYRRQSEFSDLVVVK